MDADGTLVNRHWEVRSVGTTFEVWALSDPIEYPGQLPTPDLGGPGDGGICAYNDPLDIQYIICTPYVPADIKGATIYAGDGNDHMDASHVDVPTRIFGEAGNDYLVGGSKDDYLDGREGDDYLRGSCGVDSYSGGAGQDTVTYFEDYLSCAEHVTTGVRVSLDGVANDADNENAGGPADAQGSIEHIHGTDGNDTLTGGAGFTQIYANGGNDSINVRDEASDYVECGDGSDSVTADADTLDNTLKDCETVHRPTPPDAEPPVVIKPPVKYTGTVGCPGSQKTKEVGGIKLCYTSEKKLSATRYELAGDVNLGGFLFLTSNAPLVVDTKALSAQLTGATTVTLLYSGTRYPIFKSNGELSFNLTAGKFVMQSKDSWPVLEIAKQKFGYLMDNGYINFAVTQGQKFTINPTDKSITYPAGFKLLGDALTTTGTVGYSATTGPIVAVSGCLKGSLPVGGGSRIAEITNACIAYDRSTNSWGFTGKAVLLSNIKTNMGATITNGQIDALSAGLSGFGRIPMPFAAYLDGGGIYVGGLRGNPSFSGTVTGGWPITNVASNVANLTIKGTVGYDTGGRTLTISGNGVLKTGGVQLADGNVNLKLGLGSNFAPSAMDANVNVNALGGFISGGVIATIDGTGFFASGTMNVGFQAGAEITNRVNGSIETILQCNWSWFWAPVNWCPYVTGRSVSAQAVVSNKGVGAKTSIVWLHTSVWWLANTRQFGWDLGITGSKDLALVLKRERMTYDRDGAPRAEVFDAPTPVKWEIPAGTQLAALGLEGSNTGELKVTDPTGTVVFDSTQHVLAAGVGFGRDPESAGKASFGLFPPAIKPGTWTITTSGNAPFTRVVQKIAGEPESAKVTSAIPVGRGVKPSARKLVAGVSQLRIEYQAPAGMTVALRASNGASTTMPIAADLRGSGTRVWKVPASWAGRLQILASTQRDGVPVDATKFPTKFTVTRPTLSAVGKVKVVRGAKGTVTVTWKAVRGASSYDVELLAGKATKGMPVIAHGTRIVLTPRSGDALRVRVRAVSSIGLAGKWSTRVKVKPVPVAKKPGAKQPGAKQPKQ